MEPIVSVIIPVYNVEQYVQRCIQSVCAQTLENIEILVVDDGSTDSSGKLCDQAAAGDPRIRVIHKENGGLSSARNAAIDVARGQYLSFIDSDDYIEPDMMERLYQNAVDTDSQISACGHIQVYENGRRETATKESVTVTLSVQKALDTLLFDKYLDVIACNKLYQKRLFDDLRYPLGKLYEDMFTTYKLVALCDRVVYTSDPLYVYCKRSSGSIGSMTFNENTWELDKAVSEVETYVLQHYPESRQIGVGALFWRVVLVNKMLMAGALDRAYVRKYQKKARRLAGRILTSDCLSSVRKIQLLLFAFSLPLYKKMYFSVVKRIR